MSIVDYFVPKWKNSDPEIRIKAIGKIRKNSEKILEKIVESDPDERVRIAAVEKITNHGILTGLAANTAWPGVAKSAVTRLDMIRLEQFRTAAEKGEKRAILSKVNREKLLTDLILNTEDAKNAELILERLSDERLIAMVVPELASTALRRIAIGKISDEDLLSEVTRHNCGKEIGKIIVERLSSGEALARVAEGATSRKVRKLAEGKLAAIGKLADAKLAAIGKLADAKLAAIRKVSVEPEREEEVTKALADTCRRVEELSSMEDAGEIAAGVSQAEKTFERLDPDGNHLLGERFSRLIASASLRLEALEGKRDLTVRLLGICDAVEKTVVGVDSHCRREVEGLKADWASLDLSILGEEEQTRMTERFGSACSAFDERYRIMAEEKQGLTERIGRLAQCCTRMEALGERAGKKGGRESFDEIVLDWERLYFSDQETIPLKDRFENAEDAFLKNEGKIRSVRQAAEKRLVELCEIVERAAGTKEGNRFELEGQVKEARKEWRNGGSPVPEIKRELESRFKEACDRFHEQQAEFREALDWEMWSNLNLKKRIVAEFAELSREEELFRVARKIRELTAGWEKIGPVSREKAGEITGAYNRVLSSSCERCMAEKRKLHKGIAEEHDAPHSEGQAKRIRLIQEEWKKMGPLPLAEDRVLGKEFRTLCDAYYENRRVLFRKMDEERHTNLRLKEELCETAESLCGSSDWIRTAEALKELQQKWKKIGPVPKSRGDELWTRFREACDSFFTRLEKDKPENLKKKESLVERLEALMEGVAEEGELEKLSPAVIELQKEWKKIGPVPKEHSEALWTRFKQPCDLFFQKRNENRVNNQAAKEELLKEAEKIAEDTTWKETGEKLVELQKRWKTIGPAPRNVENGLWKRFHGACNHFFNRRSSFFASLDRERNENLRLKEKLCASLELLAQIAGLGPSGDNPGAFPMAEQLRMGMDLKDEIAAGGERETRENAMRKFRKIREEWSRTGPVPRKHEREIRERFTSAQRPFIAS